MYLREALEKSKETDKILFRPLPEYYPVPVQAASVSSHGTEIFAKLCTKQSVCSE